MCFLKGAEVDFVLRCEDGLVSVDALQERRLPKSKLMP